MGSKGGGTQEVKNEPWEGLQPYLSGQAASPERWEMDGMMPRRIPAKEGITGLLPEAARLYDEGPNSFFGGQTYANFDPLQRQSQNAAIDYAQNGLLDNYNTAQSAYSRMTDGSLLDVNSNPYLRGNIDAFADSVNDNLMLTDISNNEDAAQMAGQFGSSRHGIADGLAKSRAADTIARYSSNMMNDAYGKGLNSMTQGLSMSPMISELGMGSSNILNRIGKERQAQDQLGINEAMARHEYDYNAPWMHLNNFASPLTGNYMGAGGTTTQPTTGSNPIAGLLGGATAGAGLMQALESTNPWIAGGGAALGLLGAR